MATKGESSRVAPVLESLIKQNETLQSNLKTGLLFKRWPQDLGCWSWLRRQWCHWNSSRLINLKSDNPPKSLENSHKWRYFRQIFYLYFTDTNMCRSGQLLWILCTFRSWMYWYHWTSNHIAQRKTISKNRLKMVKEWLYSCYILYYYLLEIIQICVGMVQWYGLCAVFQDEPNVVIEHQIG